MDLPNNILNFTFYSHLMVWRDYNVPIYFS